MTRLLLSVVVVASVVSTTSAQAPQTPARDQPAPRPASATPAPRGHATVSGVVSSGDQSAQPIRMATVVLIGQTTGTLKVTMTDASGAFAFRDLAADRYLVGASKRPYVGAMAGATRPMRPGSPVAVTDGQTVANVAIKLTPGSAIAGTVRDDSGRPASNVTVTVKQWRTRAGDRSLVGVAGGSVVTDDRGQYRVFGLPPGQYIVYAQPPPAPIGVPLRDADVDRALAGSDARIVTSQPAREYVPAYATGSATSLADAATIDLGPGDDREGTDIELVLAHLVRVDGTISFADGSPISQGTLSASGDDPNQPGRFSVVAPNGRFQMMLRSGRQTLQFIGRPGSAHVGIASIDVGAADQTGLQVVMRPGLTLSGTLGFAGATMPAVGGRQIPVHAVSPAAETAHPTPLALTNSVGGFSIANLLPGQYIVSGPMRFGATEDSLKWTIGAVAADGKDVTDLPIVLTADGPSPTVVVTMTDVWQSVSGKIEGASPDATFNVLVFPADKTYWLPGSRRIRTVRAGSDGTFTIGGPGIGSLPAGAYLLAVLTDVDDESDPTFLESIRSASTPITIAPGARVTQNVRIR